MTPAILNIGLARNDGAELGIAIHVALLEMRRAGFAFAARPEIAIWTSNTEKTLVIEVDDIGSDEQIDQLCQRLAQDCIAILPLAGGGFLAGPKASDWGPFDPAQFILPDGTKLSAQQKAA